MLSSGKTAFATEFLSFYQPRVQVEEHLQQQYLGWVDELDSFFYNLDGVKAVVEGVGVPQHTCRDHTFIFKCCRVFARKAPEKRGSQRAATRDR